MEKVYVIKQNYLIPHDLQPQIELHHICYTSIEDARTELNNLYQSDKKIEVFQDLDYEDKSPNEYELITDDYWSIAEIVELTKI